MRYSIMQNAEVRKSVRFMFNYQRHWNLSFSHCVENTQRTVNYIYRKFT